MRAWAAALVLGLVLAGCGVSRAVPAAVASASSSSSASASGAWIRLSPATGGPGTVVTVTGYLPGLPAANAAPSWRSGSVCWDGCGQGLVLNPQWQWSATRTGSFSTSFTVPSAAWVTAAGPHALVSGTYNVGIRCVGPVEPGCGLRGAQASATFRLVAPPPTLCAAGQACARLALDPAAAAPGDTVKVNGWAPLTQMFGSNPTGYTLVLSPGDQLVGQASQTASGDLTGTFTVPRLVGGGGEVQPLGTHTLTLRYTFGAGARVDLAPTALTVAAGLSWAGLGAVRPLWIRGTRGLSGYAVTGAAATDGAVAVCGAAGGGIRVSADGGATWSDVSTAGAVAATAGTGFVFQQGPSAQGPSASCEAALPDLGHAGSFYATFNLVAASCGCAPPYIPVGFVTVDDGSTWRTVPPPQGFTVGDFGGFEVDGSVVSALFSRRPASGDTPVVAVERTSDGGRTWAAGAFACLGSGPCVRWGPRPTSVNACMAEQGRSVLGSDDGGRTWRSRTVVDLCQGAADLAAIGPSNLLLISGQSAFPVGVSSDGGRTWRAVALPAVPTPVGTQTPRQYPGLHLLPGGTLAVADGTAMMLLPPGAAVWCPAVGVSVPQGATGFTVVGGRWWWTMTPPKGGSGMSVVNPGGVPLSALHCAG